MRIPVPLTLLIVYITIWIWAAIKPLNPEGWWLENLLPGLFVPLFVFTFRRFQFSNTSYVLIFLFMSSHALAAHYTYAEVPYDEWARRWLHFSINELFDFERNHFDRLIHFFYGLLIAIPYREWLNHVLLHDLKKPQGIAGHLLTLEFILASSAVYELIEWAAAEVFGQGTGMAFLGIQGDVWDAHWDVLLAGLGAALTLTLVWFWERRHI